jgi:hypothetical protein
VRWIGAKIAGEIAAEYVTGQLTAAQNATTIAALLDKLKTHGVRTATLQRLAPSALTAALRPPHPSALRVPDARPAPRPADAAHRRPRPKLAMDGE